MSNRTFDPEEARRVGQESVPKLVIDYQQATVVAHQAGRQRDGAISPELAEDFDAYFKLMYNALLETSENLDRLGPALVTIADDDELAENEITHELEEAAAEAEAGFSEQDYTPMSEEDKPEDLEQAPNLYEDELNSESDNYPQ